VSADTSSALGGATARSPRVALGVLVLIATVATLLRLYGFGAEDYWLDELHSLMNSGGRYPATYALPHGQIVGGIDPLTPVAPDSDLFDVWRTCRRDLHPPLYFLTLRVWRAFAGDGEAATRSLSAACSVLALLPMVLMFRALARARAGTYAAIVLACSFSSIYMAQQARPYSLSLLLVCISYWLFVECLARSEAGRSRPVIWAAVYALALLLAVMTHYFAVLALVPQVVYALRGKNRSFTVRVVAAAGGAASLWCLLWGGAFVEQLALLRQQTWLDDATPGHAIRTLQRTLDLPVRLLLAHELHAPSLLRGVAGVLIAVGVASLLRRSRPAGTGLLASWAVVPVAALLLVDLLSGTQALAYLRYSEVAVPALCGLIGLALDALSPLPRRALLAAVAVAFVLTIRLPTVQNAHAREAAREVAAHDGEGALVIYDGIRWPRHWPMRQLTLVLHYLRVNHPPFVLLREVPATGLFDAISSHPRLIIVAPEKRRVEELLGRGYRETLASDYIEGVGYVYVYDARRGG